MASVDPPLLGERLALEFANTRFIVRRHEHDGLETSEELGGWLRRVQERLPHSLAERDLQSIDPAHLATARELRDAIRALLTATTARAQLEPEAAEVLNQAVRRAPEWLELTVSPTPGTAARTAADSIGAALASIAADGIRLLGEPDARAVRACSAPGCVLYFEKDHPRRSCCSARCSNRVRAARHYARRTAAGRSTAP